MGVCWRKSGLADAQDGMWLRLIGAEAGAETETEIGARCSTFRLVVFEIGIAVVGVKECECAGGTVVHRTAVAVAVAVATAVEMGVSKKRCQLEQRGCCLDWSL